MLTRSHHFRKLAELPGRLSNPLPEVERVLEYFADLRKRKDQGL